MANDDTSTSQDGTPDDAASVSDAAQTASQAGNDEVSVLKSRYAGQTAKVEELSKSNKQLAEEREALKKALDEAQRGIADKDDIVKGLLSAKDEELARERAERRLERIETRFPETYATLGEAAVNLTDEALAANEARIKASQGEESEPPTPRGQQAPRTDAVPAGGREPKTESSADILAKLRGMAVPDHWGG